MFRFVRGTKAFLFARTLNVHTASTSLPAAKERKDKDTAPAVTLLVKKPREDGYLLYNLTKNVSHCKKEWLPGPFPFIPLLEARCLCLPEDRRATLPATQHWSNTWELPLAWWEKQQAWEKRVEEADEEEEEEE